MGYPKIQENPYCCYPGCPNPASHVELVTGIGVDPIRHEPFKRVRCVCKFHIGKRRAPSTTVQEYGLETYMEMAAGKRVLDALAPPEEQAILERLRARVDTLK
jgi:hypothetical protein